jgi:hypothetical protein
MTCRIPGAIIREAQESDYPLILDSYTRALCRGEPFAALGAVVGPAMVSSLLLRLINLQECLVLCDSADPDTIYGWALGDREARTLHGIYVIRSARGSGAADALLLAMYGDCGEPITVTLYTTAMHRYITDQRFRRDSRPIFDVLKGAK